MTRKRPRSPWGGRPDDVLPRHFAEEFAGAWCTASSCGNARAMGESGAVSVVSGHVRGLTTTMPLHVEILYNEYNFVGSFAVASLLTLLAGADPDHQILSGDEEEVIDRFFSYVARPDSAVHRWAADRYLARESRGVDRDHQRRHRAAAGRRAFPSRPSARCAIWLISRASRAFSLAGAMAREDRAASAKTR